jgi:hypothetical protein
LIGWDKDSGLPTKEKLMELGLDEVVDELEATKVFDLCA